MRWNYLSKILFYYEDCYMKNVTFGSLNDNDKWEKKSFEHQ